MKRLLWIVLALAAIVVAFSLLREQGARTPPATAPEGRPTKSAEHAPAEPPSPGEPSPVRAGSSADQGGAAPAVVAQAPPSDREPVPPAALSGIVVDETGRGVGGARLSWSAYSKETIEQSAWQALGPWLVDRGALEASTVWADSDSDGRFLFPERPDPSGTLLSVIWVTHREHLAVPVLLAADRTTWPASATVELPASPPMRVVVVDRSGAGVPGAIVEGVGLPPESDNELVPLETELAVRMFLRRSVRAGPDGEALFPPLPGRFRLRATEGETASRPWSGSATSRVELVLAPTFTAGGVLTMTDGGKPYPGELSVAIEGWSGGFFHPLEQVPIDEELSWGPVEVPLSGEDRYSFALKSVTVPRGVRFLEPPEAGEHVTVDFEGSVGNKIWFALWDEDDRYLTKGKIEVWWDGLDEHAALSESPRPDGNVLLMGVPTGRFYVRGSSPGYCASPVEVYEIPEPEPKVNAIVLRRAGALKGVCLADGEPVRDFEVVYWPNENTPATARERIRGSEDGSFLLDEVPLGEIQILASSSSFAPSVPQRVTIAPGETAEVELELRASHEGEGVVVDETGIPLPSASVQLYFDDRRFPVAEWGAPVSVDPDGRFRLRDLPPGRACFVVSAPGYSSVERWTERAGAGDVDLGTIRLTPLRTLEVRFHLAGAVDPTRYTAYVGSDPRITTAPRPLSSSGVIRFGDVDERTRLVWLRSPDGCTEVHKLPRPKGREWIAEYTEGGTGRVVLDLALDTYEGKLPRTALVVVDGCYGSGLAAGRARLVPESGSAVFDDLPAGEYIASVAEPDVLTYGSILLTVREGETTRARIDLDGGVSAFRIVDEHENPVAGTEITLYSPDYAYWRRAVSDSQGLCKISGCPEMEALAGLQHPELGDLWGLPVELGLGPDEVVELELVAEGSITLRLRDGETPLAGVTCRLSAAGNRNVTVAVVHESDAAGLVSWEHLGEATYGVDLAGAGVWAQKVEVKAEVDGAPIPVQLRRTGDLRFVVTSPSGEPREGVAVEVTFLDDDTPVERWIEAGELQSVPPSTRTDAAGELLLPAIPRGTYRWRVVATSGEVLEGVVDLPPGGVVVASIEIL